MHSTIKIFLLGCHLVKGESVIYMYFLIKPTFLHDCMIFI